MAVNVGSVIIHLGVDMASEQKYWMVYGNGRGAPTHKHITKESAHKEARRLGELYPGVRFDVLKATVGYQSDRPQLKQVKLSEPAGDSDISW